MCYKIKNNDSSTFQPRTFRGAYVDQLSAESLVLLLIVCDFITAYLPMANTQPKKRLPLTNAIYFEELQKSFRRSYDNSMDFQSRFHHIQVPELRMTWQRGGLRMSESVLV